MRETPSRTPKAGRARRELFKSASRRPVAAERALRAHTATAADRPQVFRRTRQKGARKPGEDLETPIALGSPLTSPAVRAGENQRAKLADDDSRASGAPASPEERSLSRGAIRKPPQARSDRQALPKIQPRLGPLSAGSTTPFGDEGPKALPRAESTAPKVLGTALARLEPSASALKVEPASSGGEGRLKPPALAAELPRGSVTTAPNADPAAGLSIKAGLVTTVSEYTAVNFAVTNTAKASLGFLIIRCNALNAAGGPTGQAFDAIHGLQAGETAYGQAVFLSQAIPKKSRFVCRSDGSAP